MGGMRGTASRRPERAGPRRPAQALDAGDPGGMVPDAAAARAGASRGI